ncbi:MAG TPA: cupin domain-containing protein [Planctomycetota bacterium]|jgi:anti-sigma factor ChrR (cupin superfamily)|nr:cupin domain-containing protein [Planctomycetota bacterium]
MDPSIYVDTDAAPWRESPYAGVRWKKIRFDAATGESAVLLHFDPGAAYGTHRHPEGEQYLVLEGALEDGDRTWGTGTYVWHPRGSVHTPRSKKGCLLFVELPRPIEILEKGEPKR